LGIAGGSLSGWIGTFAADVATHPQRKKSVILLWLNGGPATIDLWDLKPGQETGGPYREIDTAVAGLRISEHLPILSKLTGDMAIIRSMASKEGDHDRATHLVRTGYIPQGAIQFPAVGALVARELGIADIDLPNFVSVAPARFASTIGGGFLGPNFAPLMIAEGISGQNGMEGDGGPEALTVPDLARAASVSEEAQRDRLALLDGFEQRFLNGSENSVVASLNSATARAVRLMRPEAARAFRIEDEPEALRDAYGRNLFGQGCLLARRLIERGVACVEITLGGWDTHQNNFDRVKGLSGTLDVGFGTLMADLKDRGLLESTLIICMGEFGRTPKINGNTGRDHWPQSWATVLAGGGIKGGQAIGRTNADGTAVEERPVTVPDLIATASKAVGIDPRKQNMSNVSRPIRVADPAAHPIEEIL
jgi:hypothetical protein